MYPLIKCMFIVLFWDVVQTLENSGSEGWTGVEFASWVGFSLNVETEEKYMVQYSASREGEAKFGCFPWRYTLAPRFDLCTGALSWRSLIPRIGAPDWTLPRMPEVGGALFGSICSVPKEHSLCSTPPWCSFLFFLVSVIAFSLTSCVFWLVSVAHRSLSKKCQVSSSRSGIALRFGARPHLSVPKEQMTDLQIAARPERISVADCPRMTRTLI